MFLHQTCNEAAMRAPETLSFIHQPILFQTIQPHLISFKSI